MKKSHTQTHFAATLTTTPPPTNFKPNCIFEAHEWIDGDVYEQNYANHTTRTQFYGLTQLIRFGISKSFTQ